MSHVDQTLAGWFVRFSLWRRVAMGALLFFTLASVSEAQVIRGNVRLRSTSAPGAYAIVIFSQGGSERARTITDSDGNYYVRVPVGAYDVKILRQGKTANLDRVQVSASGETFDFRVP
jgi:hypothetical protein